MSNISSIILKEKMKNELEQELIEKFKLKENYFSNNKRQNMLNLILKYQKNMELVELRHVVGFMNLYRQEVAYLLRSEPEPNDIKKVLKLFNFGQEFEEKIFLKAKEKAIKVDNQPLNENNLNKLKIQYTQIYNDLLNPEKLNYTDLNLFLKENKKILIQCFDFPQTIKGVINHFKIDKELKDRILKEEKIIKEQIKAESEKKKIEKQRLIGEKVKVKEEKFKIQKERLDYLASLGLSEEVLITQTTLKSIFPDKIINNYFPNPFTQKFNPNLSRSYQKQHGLYMKLYRLADVMEVIKKGVEPRFKNDLKDEYKKILSSFILDYKLDMKKEYRKITSKI